VNFPDIFLQIRPQSRILHGMFVNRRSFREYSRTATVIPWDFGGESKPPL